MSSSRWHETPIALGPIGRWDGKAVKKRLEKGETLRISEVRDII